MEYSITAMGISSSIILFILIMLGIVALFVGLLWLLYKVSTIFYRWLSQRKFVIEFRQRHQARKKAISRKRKMSLGEFWAEVFAEPVILTIAIVILYDHFKGIWDTSPDSATFWFRINETTRGNVLVSIFVTIALVLWMSVIILRRNREEQRDKEFEELQRTNTDKVVEAIEKLTVEIRENNKNKHGNSPTDM